MIVPFNEKQIWNFLSKKARINPGPQGFCQFYMNGEFVDQGSNLVVANGREYVAQRLFDEYNSSIVDPSPIGDVRDRTIGLFAVGAGGAIVNANVSQLQGPIICSSNLVQAINLGNTSYLDEPFSYNITDPIQNPYDIYNNNDAVKPIRVEAEGGIDLIYVDYGDCQAYTKVKCTCIIPSGEPNGLPTGGTVPISEAGLYFGLKTSGSPEVWDEATGALMFAHIMFHPKFKELESEFRILWYIII